MRSSAPTGRRPGARGGRPAPGRTRTLLATLVAALALVVAGCSSTGDAGRPSGPVELTYGIWDVAQQPAMEQIVDSFERQHPDIRVRIVLTPWDTYWTKLQTAASSRSAPDVFWMLNDHFKLYAQGGALLRLDDQVAEAGLDLGAFTPASAAGVRWEDHVYGIPKDTNSFGLFYNKQLFAAAGLAPPDATWTWKDVASAARRLTDDKRGVHGVAAPPNDVLSWYLTIPQAGGHVISDDGRSSGYADPATLEGLRFWTDLLESGASPSAQQLADTDPLALFTAGKIAMYYGGSWDPIAIAQVPDALARTGIAPLPTNLNRSFYANGIANVASSGTQHPEAAWELLQFLGSAEAADIQARSGAVIPALKGHEAAYVAAFPGLGTQVLVDQLPAALPIPSSVDTAKWEHVATRELTKAWAGQVPLDSAARTVSEQMDQLLAKEARGG